MMANRECRWCRFLRELGSQDLMKKLEEYIDSFPSEIRTSESEHERRLSLCASCEGNRNGLCRYCGCYVAARTAKKHMDCPHPEKKRWLAVQDKE